MDRTVDGQAIQLATFLNVVGECRIPLFQRGYSWRLQHVKSLLTDEWQACIKDRNPREVFLGSLVTQTSKQDSSHWNIIDGQQRLTTINLVMIALREMFALGSPGSGGKAEIASDKFNDKLLVSAECHSVYNAPERQPRLKLGLKANPLYDKLVTDRDIHTKLIQSRMEMNDEEKRLLEALECCLDFFTGHSMNAGAGLRQEVQAWAKCTELQTPSYRQFKGFANAQTNGLPESYHLGSLEQLGCFWDMMSKRTWVLWAKTYNLDWAFHVFHGLNSRGVPLTDINKLKAYVLNQWTSEEAQTSHAVQWDDSMACVGGEGKFEQILRYMAITHGMDNRGVFLDYMEKDYTELVAAHQQRVYVNQAAAQKYMKRMEHLCKLYKAVSTQNIVDFPTGLQSGRNHVHVNQPTTAQQQKQISRLFLSLKLLETGVGSTHMMPALFFLHMFCKDGSQEVASIGQTIKFFEALERHAAFYYVASSARTAAYTWSLQKVAEETSAWQRSIRYVELSKMIFAAQPQAPDFVRFNTLLALSPAQEQLFSLQLTRIARSPLQSRMPESVWKRVVMFLVKRHELCLNCDRENFHEEPNVEHILPRRPKKNCWGQWTAKQMRALLWSLGNLTLLIGPHNSKIQNNEFCIKVAQLNGRAIMFVSALKVFTGEHDPDATFTPDDCKKRGAKMIKELLDLYQLQLPEAVEDLSFSDDEVGPVARDDEEEQDMPGGGEAHGDWAGHADLVGQLSQASNGGGHDEDGEGAEVLGAGAPAQEDRGTADDTGLLQGDAHLAASRNAHGKYSYRGGSQASQVGLVQHATGTSVHSARPKSAGGKSHANKQQKADQAERLSTSVPPQDAALSAAGAASSAMPHSSLRHAALAADPQGQPSDIAADPMSAVGSKRKRDDATVPRGPNPGEIYVQMHRAQAKKDHPQLSSRKVKAKLTTKYKNLSADEKKQYKDEAASRRPQV